eukprot:6175348-Pleurochrysis_carterae.AAC.1
MQSATAVVRDVCSATSSGCLALPAQVGCGANAEYESCPASQCMVCADCKIAAKGFVRTVHCFCRLFDTLEAK